MVPRMAYDGAMSDETGNLAARRIGVPAATAVPTTVELADALADHADLSDRLAAEMARLGQGIEALRTECLHSPSAEIQDVGRRLQRLLLGIDA